MADTKLDWQGTVIGIQPRIRLTRSFDERYHTYRVTSCASRAGSMIRTVSF